MPDKREEMPAATGKLTYDDYANFPADGMRHELIDGVHVVTPSPDSRHQELSSRLHVAVGSYLRERPIGKIYAAPLDVILSQHDTVEPDLLYVSQTRMGLVRRWVHGAPDLVVEILSASTRERDESLKRRLYERSGVDEYWTVDPDAEAVVVFRRIGDRGFVRAATLSRDAGDVLTTPLLPGFSLPLAELFAG